jgi:hypothetical protein
VRIDPIGNPARQLTPRCPLRRRERAGEFSPGRGPGSEYAIHAAYHIGDFLKTMWDDRRQSKLQVLPSNCRHKPGASLQEAKSQVDAFNRENGAPAAEGVNFLTLSGGPQLSLTPKVLSGREAVLVDTFRRAYRNQAREASAREPGGVPVPSQSFRSSGTSRLLTSAFQRSDATLAASDTRSSSNFDRPRILAR